MHQVIHLFLVLGNRQLGAQLAHLPLGGGDIIHQLAGHLAHLVAVGLGQLVGIFQVLLFRGQLGLGIQELSGVIIIARHNGLLGIAVKLGDLLVVGGHAAARGHLIGDDGRGLRLQLLQVGTGVSQVLFQQLAGVLFLGVGKQAVDVRAHNVRKSLQNTHYRSS